MIYLIAHQFWFLALAFAFAALAGWAWAGMQAQPKLDAVAHERERLMRDLLSASGENGAAPSPELDRQMDSLKLRADMAQVRVAELERTAEAARSRAEEAAGRAAELERALASKDDHGEEVTRLREQVAAHTEQERQTLDVVATPSAANDEAAAQGWRLRYFEQRVRYLENQARGAGASMEGAVGASVDSSAQQLEWRARLAEARAGHLEEEARTRPAIEPVAPESTAMEEDSPLRWRAPYLEKRVQHLRAQPAMSAVAPVAPPAVAEPDNSAELAKWRARYLESRVRHLEAMQAVAEAPATVAPSATPQPTAAPEPLRAVASATPEPEEVAPPPPLVPAGAEERPSALPAAQSGAPDDLSLIEGVSLLQHSTLNALGIYHFEQIAEWSPANIAWVDQYLRLRGRITQEDWVGQAQRLAREGPPAAQAAE